MLLDCSHVTAKVANYDRLTPETRLSHQAVCAAQARYAWAPPAFNPNASSTSSSGLLASLKDKVKRIR